VVVVEVVELLELDGVELCGAAVLS